MILAVEELKDLLIKYDAEYGDVYQHKKNNVYIKRRLTINTPIPVKDFLKIKELVRYLELQVDEYRI